MSDPLDMTERGTRFRGADGALFVGELEDVIDQMVDRIQTLEVRVAGLAKVTRPPRLPAVSGTAKPPPITGTTDAAL